MYRNIYFLINIQTFVNKQLQQITVGSMLPSATKQQCYIYDYIIVCDNKPAEVTTYGPSSIKGLF